MFSLALQEKDIGDLQSRIFSTLLRKTNKSEAATDLAYHCRSIPWKGTEWLERKYSYIGLGEKLSHIDLTS